MSGDELPGVRIGVLRRDGTAEILTANASVGEAPASGELPAFDATILRSVPDSAELAVADNDQWAREAVQTSAWMHLDGSPTCLGYVMATSGRARCGRCDWALSARLEDASEARGGRFAMFVLAWIGLLVERAAAKQLETVERALVVLGATSARPVLEIVLHSLNARYRGSP